jgi:hypothetical protein
MERRTPRPPSLGFRVAQAFRPAYGLREKNCGLQPARKSPKRHKAGLVGPAFTCGTEPFNPVSIAAQNVVFVQPKIGSTENR